jgi:SWI/SNF-related matrix-associated actin-dependent regulator 1 of chromatin subfamily A
MLGGYVMALYPVPKSLNYLPYQRDAIAFALEHENCLIADEMGLGKTIEAIGVSNALPSARRVLIVCPASLKLNWQREWERWDVKHLSVGIVTGDEFPDANVEVVIINYELLKRHSRKLRCRTWHLLIVDECHKLKNDGAQRTAALLGKRHWNSWRKCWEIEQESVRADRMLFLTGTPLLNRPAELWTIVRALDPEGLGRGKSWFETRYCNGHMRWVGNGIQVWDKGGASNLNELNWKMQRFMIRRLKQDVLRELPAKRRQVIVLETTKPIRKLLKAEREAFEKLKLRNGGDISFFEMSSERKAVAMAKVPALIEHIHEILESKDKVVVMAHHHKVIDLISSEFGKAVAIVDGRTPVKARQAEVDRFQNDPSCNLFICSIQLGGTGFTLTAADTVVFAELDWVPGNLTQAEDRLHRIGQHRPVFVQHIVLNSSLDAEMIETVIRKQKVVTAVLKPIRLTIRERRAAL